MLLDNTFGMKWLTTIFQTLKHTATHHPEEELDILSTTENVQAQSSNGRRDVIHTGKSGLLIYNSRRQTQDK